MKPTRNDYNDAMIALERLNLAAPELTPALDAEICCLDYTAGMYACAENTHYSREQFNAALTAVRGATPEFSFWFPRQPKPTRNEAPKPGNKKDRRRADVLAHALGLTDRDGRDYMANAA